VDVQQKVVVVVVAAAAAAPPTPNASLYDSVVGWIKLQGVALVQIN